MTGVNLTLAQIEASFPGFALTRQIHDEVELLLLAVSKHWQSKGIGGELLKNCIDASRIAGARTMHLEVRANNSAIKFYEKFDFEQVHRRPSYYRGSDGTSFDALSYRLYLG